MLHSIGPHTKATRYVKRMVNVFQQPYICKNNNKQYQNIRSLGTLYEQAYQESIESPETFWGKAAQDIKWYKPYSHVLEPILPNTSPNTHRKWFIDGEMNTCYNAVDVHVENGRGDNVAIYYDSPLTQVKRRITYKELLSKVSALASGLKELGVEKGDRVVIYMPVIVEAAVAMLACARIGAIHSVVFGGFASNELAIRINDAKPKIVIAASGGIEPKGVINYIPLLNGALSIASHEPSHCIIFDRDIGHLNQAPSTGDISRMHNNTHPAIQYLDWNTVVTEGTHNCPPVPVLATDPLYILYTSGTTGTPKGVVRDNGGHAVAMKWSMRNLMDTHEGEIFWAASDIGWVVGHSYMIYAPLLTGCTTILYEGKPIGTPDAAAYWRIISEYKVKTMFTAPTALRAIRKEDPDLLLLHDYKDMVLSTLKAIFVAGERGDPKTLASYSRSMKSIPIVDNWWQTETGWPICATALALDNDYKRGVMPNIKFGSVSRPVPGFNVSLMLDEIDEKEHHDEEPDHELVIKLPLPPGCLKTLYKHEDIFEAKYMTKFPGYYHTGDTGHIDEDGYVYVMSRSDDVINVAGHRLCTGSIEEVIQSIPEVIECAVFAAADRLKGHVPVALVVLTQSNRSHQAIREEIIHNVRMQMGSFVCLRDVAVVTTLPKTRSGKIVRGTIQAIADSREYKVPATIENESVLDDVRKALQTIGYAK